MALLVIKKLGLFKGINVNGIGKSKEGAIFMNGIR